MLHINNLFFSFEESLLEDINLSLQKGSIHCLVGSNGSGKSTLFRLLHGELKPQSGEIMQTDNEETLYLPVQYEIAPFLTEQQLYDLIVKTNKVSLNIDPDHIISQNKILADYSTGMLQQVMLNLVNASRQEIILLDEPLATLDMVNKEIYIERIKKIAESGKIVIISTQEPDVAYQLRAQLLILTNKTIKQYQETDVTYEAFKEMLIAHLKQSSVSI